MGEYYVGARSRQILALLRKLGLRVVSGRGGHDKAIAESGHVVPIPRHRDLSNGVVEDICNFLIEEGYDKSVIDSYIK